MSKHTNNQVAGERAGVVDEEDREVVYVEVPRRRDPLGQRVRRWSQAWTEASVDAELPARWRARLPEEWDGPAGRAGMAVVALLVLALWVAVVLWLMG
ncbi:hypothetical protein AAG742_03250 [Micrococcus sp. 2A]|uniref:hypothetical protein n=1 Tax=Micrococcus sp. 2A TaxID=3142261 RepID=UPI0031BA7A84